MRIQAVPKSQWSGEILTPFRILGSIEAVSNQHDTELLMFQAPSAQHLLKTTFIGPSSKFCVSIFPSIRGQLSEPFRITFKGLIVDISDVDYTQSQNAKCTFDLMGSKGADVKSCAMAHNSTSTATRIRHEVICYFGTGRGLIGSSLGIIYMMKDAMILPIGNNTRLPWRIVEVVG